MEPKIKDHLHLYLGQNCYVDGLIYKLEPKHFPSNWQQADLPHKLILRTVSELTDAEYLQCSKILKCPSGISEEAQIHQVKELLTEMHKKQTNIHGTEWVLLCIYLIKIGVDLFNLIEAGLAINKLSLKEYTADEQEK